MTEKYAGMNSFMKIAIFVRRFLLIGSWTPLWFFLALCTATILVFILLKVRRSPKAILIFSLLVYIFIGCLSSAYSMVGEMLLEKFVWLDKIARLYTTIFGVTGNGFIFGFFYVALGMNLAIVKKDNSHQKKNVICFILAIMALFVEVTIVSRYNPNDYGMMLMLIPCTYFGFCFFKDLNLKDSKIWIWLWNMSVLMYGLHGLFTEIKFGNSVIHYLFVLSVTLVCATIIIILQKHIKWLKVLY